MQLDMCSKSPTTLLFLLFWAPGYTHIQLRSFNPPFYPSCCSRKKSYQAFPGYIWNFSVCISEQGSLGARLHLHIVYTCQAEGEQLCTQDAHMLPGNYSSQISESWGLRPVNSGNSLRNNPPTSKMKWQRDSLEHSVLHDPNERTAPDTAIAGIHISLCRQWGGQLDSLNNNSGGKYERRECPQVCNLKHT